MRTAALVAALVFSGGGHAALYVCDGPQRTVLRDYPCEPDEQLAHAYAPREPAPRPRYYRHAPHPETPTAAQPPTTPTTTAPAGSWSALIEERQRAKEGEELRILRDLQRRQILRDAWQK